MATAALHTKIGCEVFIRKGDHILLGKRKNCFGAGSWALPGGHLEFNERLVDAVCREIYEELGAKVKPDEVALVSIVDDIKPEQGTHYIHVSFELRDPDFEPQLMEPDLCEAWRYFPLARLPDNLFSGHAGILDNYTQKRLYLI